MIGFLIWVVPVFAFVGMVLWALMLMSDPSPQPMPKILQWIMLPFCYIVVIIITVYKRDWKKFKTIRKWQF